MLLGTINALTLCTCDMRRSCAFYTKLGLTATYGGPSAEFTTFSASAPVTPENNALHINLVLAADYKTIPQPRAPGGWGRAVIFVGDVDQLHAQLTGNGLTAPWGERCFHLVDPDGHELSFATPQYEHPRWSTARGDDALAAANDVKLEDASEVTGLDEKGFTPKTVFKFWISVLVVRTTHA